MEEEELKRLAKLGQMMKEFAPKFISNEIKLFCKTISLEKPVFVSVKPSATSIRNECHTNLPKHVLQHGGEMVTGWAIWQSDLIFHAECHCVWKKDGLMIDITPKADREKKILYLPDPSVKFVGKIIPSHRQARIEDESLNRSLALRSEIDRIRAQHDATQPLDAATLNRLKRLDMEVARADMAILPFGAVPL